METWWTDPKQLDRDQTKILDLEKGKNHLVVGPPGCGKTNLLILRAEYLVRSKISNVLVLTFTRSLREFIAAGAEDYGLPSDRVMTFVRWGASILKENGIDFKEDGDFERLRETLDQKLDALAAKARPENIYDCILVDEAQDYTPVEIELIRKFAKCVFAVGDRRQQIYGGNGAIDLLSSFCKVSSLSTHYRNGLKICRVADGMLNLIDAEEGLEATSNYDEKAYPSSVEVFGDIPLSAQIANAIKGISTQLRAYPDTFIGVMCPRHEELSAVHEALAASPLSGLVQLQRFEEGFEPLSKERPIILTSVHGAKGLEFRACHILGLDKIKRFALQKNMAYTGVTRAKTSLSLYHEAKLPGYIDNGINALSEEVAEEALPTGWTFKGKK